MPLRLNGAESGYVELSAPAIAGNNNIVLPTSGTVVTTDASQTLTNKTITNPIITATQGSVRVPGTIIQVVQTVKTDTFASSFGAVWGDITGMSVSITPSSSSNRVLILLDLKYIGDTDISISRIRLVRNSTEIYIGDAASNRSRSSGGQNYTTGSGSSGVNVFASGGIFLDSPATTSPITYKVQGGGDSNATIFYLNRTESDRDTAYYDTRTASSITAMEVVA